MILFFENFNVATQYLDRLTSGDVDSVKKIVFGIGTVVQRGLTKVVANFKNLSSPFPSKSVPASSGTTFSQSSSTQRTYLILLMSLRNQQSNSYRDYGVGGNNLFSSIRWYGVAARCVRLTTLGEASSKFAFQICYLKVFSDFSLYIHQFWLVRQNNADIRVFHPLIWLFTLENFAGN